VGAGYGPDAGDAAPLASKVLMFLLDPTQDPRFRARCMEVSQDPQIVEPLQTVRQETILSERRSASASTPA